MDAQVTVEELKWFHSIKQQLFSRLVIDLKQDILLAWEVITFWIWLEEAGFPNIIMKLLTLSNSVVRYLTNEAMVCLDCIKTGRILAPPLDDIPFMNLLTKKCISLQFFHDNRMEAMGALLRVIENIRSRGFEWQLLANATQSPVAQIRTRPTGVANQPAVPQRRIRSIGDATHYGGTMVSRSRIMVDDTRERVRRPFGEGNSRGSDTRERLTRPFGEGINRVTYNKQIQIRPFGEGCIRVADLRERQTKQALLPFTQSNFSDIARPWNFRAPEDRTMFMTFSRGYPVSEREVRNFIITLHGDCIETICMQEVVPPNVHSLFALVVFKLASTIEIILDGRERANFVINGKHARVRRWEPK